MRDLPVSRGEMICAVIYFVLLIAACIIIPFACKPSPPWGIGD